MSSQLTNTLFSQIRLPALVGIVVCVVVYAIGLTNKIFSEDLQLILFPILTLCYWQLPKNREFKIPIFFLAVSTILWATSTYLVQNNKCVFSCDSSLAISRLHDDHDGLKTRQVYQRLKEISRTYHLSNAELLHKTFNSDEEAQAWLALESRSPFLLRGDSNWYRIVFGKNKRRYLGIDSSKAPQKSNKNSETISVTIPSIDTSLLITLLPEAISLPAQPDELSRHYSAWLAQGLHTHAFRAPVGNHRVSYRSRSIATRRDAFNEALLIDGAWKSPTAHGLAHFLLGTLDLVEAKMQDNAQPALLSSALTHMKQAAGLISRKHDKELEAAIFNNAAVALLAVETNKQTEKKAIDWLMRAGTSQFLGGKVARENLEKLLE